jgi:Mg2+/Co2+ transporter CorB
MLYLMHQGEFTRDNFESLIREPYYVPEGTPLTKQLLSFQKEKRRVGLVVDEYGDIQGLITLEDILEEIVGEFTTDPASSKDIYEQHDGSFIVDGGTHLRDLNKTLLWDLPTDGPKTLNGLITEYLEMIPKSGTSLKLMDMYPIEIVIAENNAVKTVRVYADPVHAATAK